MGKRRRKRKRKRRRKEKFYTRADAIKDGFFIPVSKAARKLGIVREVDFAIEVWQKLVEGVQNEREQVTKILRAMKAALDAQVIPDDEPMFDSHTETGKKVLLVAREDRDKRAVATWLVCFQDEYEEEENMFEDADVIFSYSRKQAIEDGVLIDVSETANEAGFKIPVAVTHAVWSDIIVPDAQSRTYGQSEAGRLWDVLTVLRHAIARKEGKTDMIFFEVLVIRDGKPKPEKVKLKSICGPNDDGSPCITILLPQED